MSMYTWKVTLDVQYKSTWKEGKVSKSSLWEESGIEYTVASPSGIEAMEKCKQIFMKNDSWEGEHHLDNNQVVPTTESPNKVLDITGLEFLDCLDG